MGTGRHMTTAPRHGMTGTPWQARHHHRRRLDLECWLHGIASRPLCLKFTLQTPYIRRHPHSGTNRSRILARIPACSNRCCASSEIMRPSSARFQPFRGGHRTSSAASCSRVHPHGFFPLRALVACASIHCCVTLNRCPLILFLKGLIYLTSLFTFSTLPTSARLAEGESPRLHTSVPTVRSRPLACRAASPRPDSCQFP